MNSRPNQQKRVPSPAQNVNVNVNFNTNTNTNTKVNIPRSQQRNNGRNPQHSQRQNVPQSHTKSSPSQSSHNRRERRRHQRQLLNTTEPTQEISSSIQSSSSSSSSSSFQGFQPHAHIQQQQAKPMDPVYLDSSQPFCNDAEKVKHVLEVVNMTYTDYGTVSKLFRDFEVKFNTLISVEKRWFLFDHSSTAIDAINIVKITI